MQFYDNRLPVRFWSKVMPCPVSGCWLWVGAVTSDGYGSFYVNGSTPGAHRAAFTATFGAPAAGLELDHRCRTRCCVNPLHVEAVTHRVNMLRGGGMATANAARQVCINGHAFDAFNTRIERGTGRRKCRACQRDRSRRRQNYKGTQRIRCGLCGGDGHSRRNHERYATLIRGAGA